jgi:hypothetical protein
MDQRQAMLVTGLRENVRPIPVDRKCCISVALRLVDRCIGGRIDYGPAGKLGKYCPDRPRLGKICLVTPQWDDTIPTV